MSTNDSAGEMKAADAMARRLKSVHSLEEGRQVAYTALATKLAETLGLPSEDITPDRPTADYALDSIVAVTVRNLDQAKNGGAGAILRPVGW